MLDLLFLLTVYLQQGYKMATYLNLQNPLDVLGHNINFASALQKQRFDEQANPMKLQSAQLKLEEQQAMQPANIKKAEMSADALQGYDLAKRFLVVPDEEKPAFIESELAIMEEGPFKDDLSMLAKRPLTFQKAMANTFVNRAYDLGIAERPKAGKQNELLQQAMVLAGPGASPEMIQAQMQDLVMRKTRTAKETQALSMGYRPGTPQWNQFMSQPSMMFSLSAADQLKVKEEGLEIEDVMSQVSGVRKAATDADDSLDKLQFARSRLTKAGVKTGTIKMMMEGIASIASELGIISMDTYKPFADTKELGVIASDVVLRMAERMSGALSENDMKFLQSSNFSTENAKLANEYILQSQIAFNKRAQERLRFYSDYKRENGTYRGADISWSKHRDSIPISLETGVPGDRPIFFYEFIDNTKRKARRAGDPIPSNKELLDSWQNRARLLGYL